MSSPQVQIAALRAYVRDLDHSLTEGRIPPEGMEDLKTAVDELRSRVWAIMTAASSPDGPGVMQRFRLRRAMETIVRVTADTRAGRIGRDQREFLLLANSAREFLEVAQPDGRS